MPFKSEKQRRLMWAKHPEIAKKWAHEKGFYTHNTHASMQWQEESVKTSGDGFSDAYIPKRPTTDSFHNGVQRVNF